MELELLLSEHFSWEGQCYLVQVYRCLQAHMRCSHMAKTTLGPDDDIIVDGASVDEVLSKQQAILPLAILSRSIAGQPVNGNGAMHIEKAPRIPTSLPDRQHV
ncbi:MAG: hypothetical protein ETSY1_04890 [Candidatus Entotheonella factor]|uniref:Uncharacterized protein n=2 Tax=Candidatus Entotheonella TaxID=93171 RepID=W4LWE6_ENTF1|nr:MAG: hypothetical protein ETSY1_04890 [Candidatus Entotheonella factor]